MFGSSVKHPLFLSDLKKNNFLNRFSKNTYILIFTKICLLGAEFFPADEQTDITPPIVALRSFANAPNNLYIPS